MQIPVKQPHRVIRYLQSVCTCSKMPWMWLCGILESAVSGCLGRVSSRVVNTMVNCSLPARGCKARAAIMRVLYTGLLLHLKHRRLWHTQASDAHRHVTHTWHTQTCHTHRHMWQTCDTDTCDTHRHMWHTHTYPHEHIYTYLYTHTHTHQFANQSLHKHKTKHTYTYIKHKFSKSWSEWRQPG